MVSGLVQRMNLIQRDKAVEVEAMGVKVDELLAALDKKIRSRRRGDLRARRRRAELVFAKEGREERGEVGGAGGGGSVLSSEDQVRVCVDTFNLNGL